MGRKYEEKFLQSLEEKEHNPGPGIIIEDEDQGIVFGFLGTFNEFYERFVEPDPGEFDWMADAARHPELYNLDLDPEEELEF